MFYLVVASNTGHIVSVTPYPNRKRAVMEGAALNCFDTNLYDKRYETLDTYGELRDGDTVVSVIKE